MPGNCGSTKSEGAPGTAIVSNPPLPVPILGIVPIPIGPAGTTRVTVQNSHTGVNNPIIRVRELGGAPLSGALLGPLQSVSFGGGDGALTALEVEGDPVFAATANVIYERRQ